MARDLQDQPLRLVGTLTDITDHWSQEEAFQHTQRLESLGLLAGNIAHDFNNLLFSMQAQSNLARAKVEAGGDPTPALAYLDLAIQRSTDLVRQLLDYSGKGDQIQAPVDLGQVARDMVGLLGLSVPKGIRLELRISEGLPKVQGNSSQLQQVILNLVTNAADAIGEAQGRILVTVQARECATEALRALFPHRDLPSGPYLLLEVCDDGCGMNEDVLKHLFDPFFTTKAKGRGLGLASLMGIVRSHRGAHLVTSKDGEGTTFTIYFPALP